jgi:hypothetical protein
MGAHCHHSDLDNMQEREKKDGFFNPRYQFREY